VDTLTKFSPRTRNRVCDPPRLARGAAARTMGSRLKPVTVAWHETPGAEETLVFSTEKRDVDGRLVISGLWLCHGTVPGFGVRLLSLGCSSGRPENDGVCLGCGISSGYGEGRRRGAGSPEHGRDFYRAPGRERFCPRAAGGASNTGGGTVSFFFF